MFLRYLEPVFRPWRAIRNKIVRVKTTRGNIRSEARRVSRFGNYAKQQHRRAKKFGAHVQTDAQGQETSPMSEPARVDGPPPAAPARYPAAVMSGPGPVTVQQIGTPMVSSNVIFIESPPIRIRGFFWKKKFCTQCERRLDMSWDRCPYCKNAYRLRSNRGSSNTQALKLARMGNGVRTRLGWLVPVNGAQRGELYTLAEKNVVGKDTSSTIVIKDEFMSGRHIEIILQDDKWMLRDLGSVNGTLVNDKPVVEHELIDSDFIGIGSCVLKFKSM